MTRFLLCGSALMLAANVCACGDDEPDDVGGAGGDGTAGSAAGASAGTAGTAGAPGTAGTGGAPGTTTQELGLVTVPSTNTAAAAITALGEAIDANAMVAEVLRVDHQANGATVMPAIPAIPPSTVFLFGNPNLGTVLMQANPLAGLDLPLRILIWDDAGGTTRVSYDSPAYLQQRYALTGVDMPLMQARMALANFASAATGEAITADTETAPDLSEEEGIVRTMSANDAATTFAQLLGAIDANPMLTLATTIDHQANAEGAGLELGFISVAVFGNPAIGTPLIEAAPTMGLDLPLKSAVVDLDGTVWVIHNDPVFLANKHGGITGQDQRLQMVSMALQNLANAAAAAP